MAGNQASGSGDAEIMGEAARWMLRAQAGLSGAEQRAFRAWLAERGEHAAAADAVASAWQAAPEAAYRANLVPPPRRSRLNALRERYADGWSAAGWQAATAMLVAPLLIAGVWWYANCETRQLATGPNQRAVATLADGSTVWMAPRSRLVARLDPLGRRVELQEGEVTLQVAHQRRGFVLDAGRYRIVDRGTVFDVRRRGRDPVTVALVSGRIDISERATGRLLARPMPGERVALSAGGAAKAPGDAQTAIAWRDGRVILDDCPLSAALAQFAEQGAPTVRIRNAAAGRLRVSGVFAVDKIDSFLSAVAELHPVVWRRSPHGYEVASR